MKLLLLIILLFSSCENKKKSNHSNQLDCNIEGQTPILNTLADEIANSMTEADFRELLVDSIAKHQTNLVYEIITNYKKGINGQSWQHYQTPLSMAAKHGNIEIAQLLLDNGANIDENLESPHGYDRGSALTEAVYASQFTMIKFLISNNITHNEPEWCTTHIAIALNNNEYEIANYLLAHAESNSIVNDGSTIFSLLKKNNYSGLKYYLSKRNLSPQQISNISSDLFQRVFFVLLEDPVIVIDDASNQIEYLLSLGANINYTNQQGNNIWLYALIPEWVPEENRDNFFKFLFSKNTNIFNTNNYGHTTEKYLGKFIHILEENNVPNIENIRGLALFTYDLDKIQELVDRGVDINITNSKGQTPFLYNLAKPNLDEYTTLINFFISNNANISLHDNNGNNAISILANQYYNMDQYDSITKAISLLLQNGFEINQTNSAGETVLFSMDGIRRFNMFQYLVEQGADISHKNNNGENILFSRLIKNCYNDTNYLQILDRLDEMGVDFKIKNKQGDYFFNKGRVDLDHLTPWIISNRWAINSVNSRNETLLFLIGNLSNKKILLDHGIDVNHKNNKGNNVLLEDNWTSLDKIKLYFEYGIDLAQKNKSGSTILFNSFYGSDKEKILEFLLSQKVNPNQRNNYGYYPFFHEIVEDNIIGLAVYSKYGADFSLKNKEGKTILDYAKEKNHKKQIVFLEDYFTNK